MVRGGLVHCPGGPRTADILVREGRVAAVGPALPARGAAVVEAAGLWVLPGGIDAHVHSRDPGFPDKEDFGSLTRAAAAGGVTTVVDMPNTIPAVDCAAVFERKVEIAAARAVVDFGLWGALRSTSTADDLEGLLEAGAVGIKAYLGYALRRANRQFVQSLGTGDPDLEAPPDYGTVDRLAPVLAARGALLAAHAEDPAILREAARPLDAYGDLLAARPPAAEAVAVAALGEISAARGLRVHVVHLSSSAGLQAARRGRGQLSLETAPQYLWATDDDYRRLGAVLKMYPPVRTAADRAALRDGLLEGAIGIVATDHAPHQDSEKLAVALEDAAAGSPGVQTLYLSCLQLASELGRPELAVEWVAAGPARLLGIDDRKGAIVAGADADLVLVDPAGRTRVAAGVMHSRQRHGVFEGWTFDFAIRAVYSRGERVAGEGVPVSAAGRGRLVRPRR